MTLYKRQGLDHTQGKERQKSKKVVWEGLTNSYEKKRSEKHRRKGKVHPFECGVPKTSKKDFLSDQCKEIEENGND